MIKIIVSGTYDGFSPRYSSDGILDDQISTHLLDRRRFFSRDADRLYKEGYSFQPLAGGILFHKIILLYDGFGRDGFVMASLFLPEGEMLGGAVIKETLDAIIRDYKVRIQNGIANVELDWSFVKIRADELNSKVQSMIWKKRPSNNGSNKTALIKGADSRVADYFQYPNPLNSGCTGYGQVFLTESLLDPAMVSDDSEQGYKVLTTDDVDIDNPEYAIVYENQQQGAKLSDERRTITKKELDSHPGNISLGTLSKPGYRSAEVMIKEADKISKDGFSVAVTLPTLVQKKASVKIDIFDNDNADMSIHGNRCTFKWSQSSFGQSKLLQPLDGVFSFYGEDCDTRWNFTIECESYETYSGEVNVLDGKTETKKVILKPKPLWNIYIQLPNGETKLNKSAIPEDDLNYYTQKAELYLKDNGLDIDKSTRDDVAQKITIVGKKKVVLEYDGNKGLGRNEEEIKDDNLPQISETYVLRLDKESQKYSLFKNYRKKACIEKEVDSAIKILEKYSTSQRNGKKNPYADKINKIIGYLRNGKLESAKNAINNLPDNFVYNYNGGKKIVDSAKNAINLTKKWKQIPDVVIKPTDVEYKYDNNSHWLECSRTGSPGKDDNIVFGNDKYSYSVDNPQWIKGKWGHVINIVHRKLLKEYRLLNWGVGTVLVVAIALCIYFLVLKKDNPQNDTLLKFYEETENIERKYPNCYCDDESFAIIDSLQNILINNDDAQKDSLYIKSMNIYKKQRSYREKAYEVFRKNISHVNTLSLEELNKMMDDKIWMTEEPVLVLSTPQKDSLMTLIKMRIDELGAENDQVEGTAEKTLYELCISPQGTIPKCNEYINKYSSVGFSNYSTTQRLQDVKDKKNSLGLQLVETAKYEKIPKERRIKACSDYCKFFPKGVGKNFDEMCNLKKDLSNVADGSSGNNKTKDEEQKPREGGSKTPINKPSDLFYVLEWKNINNFDNLFNITKDGLKKRKDSIITKSQKMKGKDYKDAWGKIKEDNSIPNHEKLTEFEKEIGL